MTYGGNGVRHMGDKGGVGELKNDDPERELSSADRHAVIATPL